MSTTLLTECLMLSEGGSAVRVDRETGVIHGVKVLGWESANGRRYDPSGVDPSLYEGRRVNAGHQKGGGDRDPRDTYAVLEGVSKAADGLYAERLCLLNPKGEFEQRLLGAAEKAPRLFGLSHTARGREKQGSGGKIIEAVESVESVDLVTDPATVAGFFESRGGVVKKKLKDLIESLKASRPGYSRALKEVAEAGIMGPEAAMDAPPDEPMPEEGKDHKAALMDALKALCDEAETLDEGELMKKFKAILKLIKGESGGGSSDEPAATTEESRRLKAENGQLLAEKLIRKAAGKAGVNLSETLVEAVARPGMTEAQAQTVVSELKGTGGSGGAGQRPRSAAPVVTPVKGGSTGGNGTPVQEGKSGDGEIPNDVKARAAWLKRG